MRITIKNFFFNPETEFLHNNIITLLRLKEVSTGTILVRVDFIR